MRFRALFRDSLDAMFRLLVWMALLAGALSAKNLRIYFIDVEGGQSTLVVTPAGESMVVDVGWPGFNGRDGDRIVKTAKKAGLKQIDYVLATHYHTDHIGGLESLTDRIRVGTIITHGPNTETGKNADVMTQIYERALKNSGARAMVVKAGDRIPLKGVDLEVVAARGDQIQKPLSGAGQANPHCAGVARKEADPTENARSIGFVLTMGRFRFADLADLTHNKELDLACPVNLLGEVDVYLTNHHGLDSSNAAPFVYGLKPRVAVMNNGARKGGSPGAIATIRKSPGLADLWMVHYSIAAGKEGNVQDSFIANLDENDEGFGIVVEAQANGGFTVTNERNKFSKSYASR